MQQHESRAMQSAHVLARAMRRLAVCGLGDPVTQAQLCTLYGPAALRISVMLQLYMARLSDCASTRLLLAAPCCRCLSPHERAILAAVGAIADRDWPAAHLALGGLVRPEAGAAAVAAAAGLAEVLVDCGGPLPPRGPRPVMN